MVCNDVSNAYFAKQYMKNKTIYDIAKALDITPSTVSRALNDHPRISAKTKAAVKEVAKQLNYKQNNLASALGGGKSNIIGLIIPRINRSFFAALIRGIEERLSQDGYHVLIAQSNDQSAEEIKKVAALLQTRVDGIIASIASETTDVAHFANLQSQGVPLVLCDRVTAVPGASTVEIDDYQGGYLATSHLLEQGYRRIVHFAGNTNLRIYAERKRGYLAALQAWGIPVVPERILESTVLLEDGVNLMQQILDQRLDLDAIFSTSDYAAMGAMQVCKQRGIAIPEQLGIVGFANEPFAEFTCPQLSSVEQLSSTIGQEAAGLLLEVLRAGINKMEPKHIVLQPELIVRNSSVKK